MQDSALRGLRRGGEVCRELHRRDLFDPMRSKFRNLKAVVSFAGISDRFAALSLYLAVTVIGLAVFMVLFNDTFYPFIPSMIGGPSLGSLQFDRTRYNFYYE